jgi:transglutaminase-like putative cysteine protease
MDERSVMNRYKVVHTTGLKYDRPVAASYNEARLLPSKANGQIVFSTNLDVIPHGSNHEYLDYFGTRTVMFEVLEPHEELTITMTSTVELRPQINITPSLGWSELSNMISSSLGFAEVVAQTKRTNPPADLTRYAKRLAGELTPHETALAICQKVHESLTYQRGVTGVNSLALEAWSNKIGVCQDFAHVTLGALRSVGIPARYVSGNLHPSKSPNIGEKVAGESHAWVEWWIGSWFAFDPTNNVEVADRHIVVGYGRDYADVPPLRGVYAGSSSSELVVVVEITKEA